MAYPLNLAFASLWFASVLAAGGDVTTPSIACIAAGVFGGAISQCLTADERKPTVKVMIGEMMAAAVMGLAAYAASGIHDPKTLVMAAGMGGGGSLGWSKFVKKYQDWMSPK